jgi:hypothetical protein
MFLLMSITRLRNTKNNLETFPCPLLDGYLSSFPPGVPIALQRAILPPSKKLRPSAASA